MLYRKFGKCDFDASILGFGCMRLPLVGADQSKPVQEGDPGKIDEEEAIRIIRYGIDNGVNYIDTAYPYHKGNSELVVGKALKDGYRERVHLATKLPSWLIKTADDFEKIFTEQLNKLQTDYVDLYLLHSLNKDSWKKIKKLGVLDFCDKIKKDGRAKCIGFSFHDSFDVFKDIIDSYNFDFCQIQYNYMDENHQAGTKGLKYAAEKGLAVVIMEPLRGGKLAKNPPDQIKEIWDSADVKRSPAEWGLRWVWNHPEVKVVLSGMGAMEQVVENIKSAENGYANSLTEKDMEKIEDVKDVYNELSKVGCTGCKYCMPCPNGVDIPGNFELYNDAYMYNDMESSYKAYNKFMSEQEKAGNCGQCGRCEKLCPQRLPIREYLKDVHRIFKK